MSINSAPTAKNLTYNGSAQALVNAGTASGGTIQYKLGSNGTYSTTIPTATNAGTYTVYYKGVADKNHTDNGSGSVSVTINPKTVTFNPAPTAKKLTYNGSAQALVNAGTALGGTIQYKLGSNGTWSTTIPTATNAGSYTVYYRGVTSDPNYQNSAEASVPVTIDQKQVTITKTPTAIPGLTYTGQAQTLINGGSATNGTMQYSVDGGEYSTALPKGTNAKTYDVKYQVVPVNSNYKGTDPAPISNVKIDPVSPVVTKEPAAINGLKYTGNAQALITAGTATGGTMKYKLSTEDESKWRTTVPTATNAGDYIVQWKIFADSNHTDTSVETITVTIAPIPSEANPEPKAITGLVYNGNAQALVTAGAATGGTMYYKLSTEDESKWRTTVPTATNANENGYTVQWKVTGDGNHTNISGTITVPIAKHPNEVEVTANKLTYTGSAQALVTAGQPTGGTLKFSTDGTNWSTTVPTATNAGKYDVWYRVDGGTNYEDIAAAKLTAEIERVPVVLTAPTAKDLTYNGEEQELITKGSVQGGTLQYMDEDSTWKTTIPTGIDARTYDISYRVIPDANHIGIDKTPINDVEINKHPVKYTVEPEALHLTYNGDEQALLSAGTADYGTVQYRTNGEKWSTNIPTGIDADKYEVYYRIQGLNRNYETTEAKPATPIIDKAVPVVTAPTAKTLKYNGNSQTLVNAGKTSGGTMKYSLTGGDSEDEWSTVVPSAVNAGTYTVYYKVDGGHNYYDVEPKSLDNPATIEEIPPYITPAPEIANEGLFEISDINQELIISGKVVGGTVTYYVYDSDGTLKYSGSEIPTVGDIDEMGEYEVYYSIKGDSNHKNLVQTLIGQLTVDLDQARVLVHPTAIDSLYDGTEKELVTAGTAEGGTLKYRVVGVSGWSTEIPTAVEVGTYTVIYKVFGDDDHNNSPEYTVNPNPTISYQAFEVKFDSNGGSPVDSQTIAEYGCVTEPKDPTWFNHTFLGWYNGSVKYNFDSQVTSDLTLTAKWEITNELLSSNTVSFKDNLNFNFMGKIADDAVDGAYVKVSYLHYGTPTEVIIPVNPDDMYAGKYYRFRCELTASEMTMDIKAELYLKGMNEPISTRTRSIRDYCESGLKNKNVPEVEKTLLRATLNYGGYTQAHFGYNPAPYANEGYQDSMDNVQVVSEVNFVKPTEVKEGIGYVGSTVFFRTAPFIRYYFKIAQGNNVSDYVFSINGKTLEPVYDNTVGEYEYYYIESDSELAYQLDKIQNVVVAKNIEGNTSEIFNFNYSIIKWAELASNNSTNAKERDMVKSLYAYYAAAKNFVERT